MRRLRIGLRASAIIGLALVLAPFQCLAIRFNSALAGPIPVQFHRIALKIIGLRITTRGSAHSRRPLLIVANHASWLDISVLGSLLPVSFVARADMRGWPGVNILAWLQRSIFVDRTRRAATGAAAGEIAARLAAGDAIVLFAEGTTSDGNRVLPFRSALFGALRVHSAGDTAISVQPLCIAYQARHRLPLGRFGRPALAWYGDMELGPHLLSVLGSGPADVVVVWGEPVPTELLANRKKLAMALEDWTRSTLAEVLSGRRNLAMSSVDGYPSILKPLQKP